MMISGERAHSTNEDEELRLALVMNGGVSLAVWMGGVSYEISRVVGCTHPVYQGLQDLTRTRARVDVISGSSAGGVNGAALALCCAYNKSFYPLRNVWLEKGAFDLMLRPPSEADPPSLLNGDGYFLNEMRRAFSRLIDDVPAFSPNDQPIDLTLTTTRLYGKHNRLLDDLGAIVEDATHRARFHVARGASPDPFNDPVALVEKLARAARATASFPIAFEPYLCEPAELDGYDANAKPPADVGKVHLIDGGLLDNKPFAHALRGIYSMPPSRSVRRVLLYIIPDPAVSVRKPEAKPGQEDYMPTMGEVGLASLVTIPCAQSISNQLDEIQQHNTTVQRQRGTVVTLLSTNSPETLKNLAAELFHTYKRRRIEGVIDYVLEQLQLTVGVNERLLLGKRTRSWLRAVWLQNCLTQRQQVTETDDDYWAGLIPLNVGDLQVRLDHANPSWKWGLYTIEFLSKLVLDVFRRMQQLRHLATSLHGDGGVYAIPIPTRSNETHMTDWEGYDVRQRSERSAPGSPRDARTAGAEGDHWSLVWQRAFAVEDELRKERIEDSKRIRASAPKLFESMSSQPPPRTGVAVRKEVCDWLKSCLQSGSPDHLDRPRKNAGRARELGEVLLAAKADLDAVVEAGKRLRSEVGTQALRAEEIVALDELEHLRDFFFQEGPKATAESIIRQLLTVEVVHYAVSHRPTAVDALVELVQVSARQPSVLGGAEVPEEKVAGMQLAHFAAFYKKSWRANDWMIGRLDGIDRLVRVLLNPERLHVLYAGKQVGSGGHDLPAAEYVYQFIRALALDTADTSLHPILEMKWDEQRIRNELSFLNDASGRVPDSLTNSSDAVICRLQMEVLCKEIPEVAIAVEEDKVAGADHTGFAARLARRFALLQPVSPGNPPLSPEDALQMFLAYPVGKDRLRDEVGSDLFTRTMSHAMTVVHSVASGERSGLGPIRVLMKVLKLPVWVVYLLANRLLNESRIAAAISTTVLVAGVLVVVASAFADNLSAIAAVGWSLVFGWVATALIRRRPVIVIIALLAPLLYFTNPGAAVALLMVIVLLSVGDWLPSWITTSLVAMVALWWTTGHPEMGDIIAAAGHALRGAPTDLLNSQIQQAQLFLRALGAMLVTLALILLAVLPVCARRQARGDTSPNEATRASGALEIDELNRTELGLARRVSELRNAMKRDLKELGNVRKRLRRLGA